MTDKSTLLADCNLGDDILHIDFDEKVPKADRKEYLIAAACGILSGSLSILWGRKFSLDEAQKWGNGKADEIEDKS